MSLLDDVSIVVTPNGYKAGELYAVIPVPTEGAEDVVDGGFPLGTAAWSAEAGWSLNDGYAESNGTTSNLDQSVILDVGTRYKVVITVTGMTASPLSVRLSTSSTSEILSITEDGTYTADGVAGGTTFRLRSQGFNGKVTNVSVKEYTSADMDVTRATAATRVDENGLVNYAEVVTGSDIVTNGDFATDSDWIKGTGWTISGGKANSLNSSDSFYQASSFISGKFYKVSFDITNLSSGRVSYRVNSTEDYITENGTHTITWLYDGSFNYIYFLGDNFTGSIDNVSVKEVTRDNVPRIDYTGGGCPHILAEPQRTNLITTSASGSYGNPPASEINTTAPDGTNDAIRPVPDSTSDRYEHDIAGGTYSSGDKVTYSWYRKRFSTPVTDVYIGDLNVTALVNCTQVGITTEIASSINGYDRFSATLNITDGSLVSTLRFYFGNVIGIGNSSIAYWGHQLETGSYATSYIPTSGSTVTRNQDIFTRDGIGSLINSTEGVLFVEIAALSLLSDVSRVIMLTSSDGLNYVNIYFQSDGKLTVYNNVNGANTVLFEQVLNDITLFNKCALKWGSQGYELWVNGIKLESSTSTSVPIGLSEINFNWNGGIRHFYGKVKQLQVYDTALTDNQLIQLTGEAGTHFFESYAEMASALTYTIQ